MKLTLAILLVFVAVLSLAHPSPAASREITRGLGKGISQPFSSSAQVLAGDDGTDVGPGADEGGEEAPTAPGDGGDGTTTVPGDGGEETTTKSGDGGEETTTESGDGGEETTTESGDGGEETTPVPGDGGDETTEGPGESTIPPSSSELPSTSIPPSSSEGPGESTIEPSTEGPGESTYPPSSSELPSTSIPPSSSEGPGESTIEPSTEGPGESTYPPSSSELPSTSIPSSSTDGPPSSSTPAPVEPDHKIEGDDEKPCILATIDVKVKVKYVNQNESTVLSGEVSPPDDSIFDGLCDGKTGVVNGVNITGPAVWYSWSWGAKKHSRGPRDTTSENSIIIRFKVDDDSASLTNIDASILPTNEKLFPGAKPTNVPVKVSTEVEKFEAPTGQSLTCTDSKLSNFEKEEGTITLSNVQFEIGTGLNGTFSDEVAKCSSCIFSAVFPLLLSAIFVVNLLR